MNKSRMGELFWKLTASLLIVIAISKALSLAQRLPVFYEPDPIFLLQKQFVYLAAIGLELAVAFCILTFNAARARATALIGFCGLVLLYRLGLTVSGFGDACRCLGRLFDWFPLLQKHESSVALGVLLYFLIGAIIFGFERVRPSGALSANSAR